VTLLLKLSQLIDWLNERVAKGAFWLVLVMTVISAGNASRIASFSTDSSNGLLEIQWYLFAAIFLLCSPYTLQKNEHVRIDVLSGKLSPRGLAVIDIIGTLFFLLPMVVTGALALAAAGRRVVQDQRNVVQRRRPDPLAGQGAAADRLHAARPAGHFRTDQAHRLPAGPDRRPERKDKGPTAEEELAAAIAAPKPRRPNNGIHHANMAPLMFGALVVFLLFGYPVAFALAANGIVFGLIGIELGLLTPALFQALPERIFGIMANDTLLAIPFFTFMGLILERSGMAEDLLDTIGQLFGPVRGGLALR
jgi:hypothetical protein